MNSMAYKGYTARVEFVGVAGLLIGTAVVASLIPAVRAAQVDPVNVLRGD